MIISASRRTDIPAFYSQWFMERIRQGGCAVPNPFNPQQVSQVSLGPDNVEAIVFWTRNPAPLQPHLAELDERGYRYLFQFTLTGYPALLEPHLPTLPQLLDTFRRLADQVGPERVLWRYDPILLSNLTPLDWHRQQVARLAQTLEGYTTRLTVSLFDPYRKALRRLAKLGPSLQVQVPEGITPGLAALFTDLAQIAASSGMAIVSCAEPWDLQPYGIAPGACIDADYIEATLGVSVSHARDKAQRPTCRCAQSKDIGMYNTCRHGCVYCYAINAAPPRHMRHDPLAPSLLVPTP